jgi:hypothetical protein
MGMIRRLICGEMTLRVLPTTIGRVEERPGRRSGTAKWLIIAHISL